MCETRLPQSPDHENWLNCEESNCLHAESPVAKQWLLSNCHKLKQSLFLEYQKKKLKAWIPVWFVCESPLLHSRAPSAWHLVLISALVRNEWVTNSSHFLHSSSYPKFQCDSTPTIAWWLTNSHYFLLSSRISFTHLHKHMHGSSLPAVQLVLITAPVMHCQ